MTTARRAWGRLGRRARFLAAGAAHPALRGTPVAVGPRTRLELGSAATFDRGLRCTIAGDSTFHVEGHLRWGDDVFVNTGAFLSVFESLTVGDRCRLGERVSIHDEDHVFEPVGTDRGAYRTSPVVIEDDVWIGAGSIVLRGSHIGAGSVVAAGAVVRGAFPPGSLIAGVPARVVRPLRSVSGDEAPSDSPGRVRSA
ncbi:DapH/DapD/GlmU-related protein [Kineococcus sp. LSe6-4]|uniref:DapH/DapD/GlmU-related protein n=1 Tax=Kineococcus halophytocola TaxID=3234027 RepID=A0ABV4H4Z8_9ACTN